MFLEKRSDCYRNHDDTNNELMLSMINTIIMIYHLHTKFIVSWTIIIRMSNTSENQSI